MAGTWLELSYDTGVLSKGFQQKSLVIFLNPCVLIIFRFLFKHALEVLFCNILPDDLGQHMLSTRYIYLA